MYRSHLVPFFLLLGYFPASAQTIISVSGASAGTDNELAVTQSSWTQTGTYTSVTIQATLESCEGPATGTAYLTMNGTAMANQIAINSTLSTSSSDAVVTLFSGLTLGPGTYFLTISPGANECNELWQNISGTPSVVTGSGVSAGSSGAVGSGHTVAAYPPQSVLVDSGSFLFTVTGTPATTPTTPAPPTLVLLGVGLLAMLWYVKRYWRQPTSNAPR